MKSLSAVRPEIIKISEGCKFTHVKSSVPNSVFVSLSLSRSLSLSHPLSLLLLLVTLNLNIQGKNKKAKLFLCLIRHCALMTNR